MSFTCVIPTCSGTDLVETLGMQYRCDGLFLKFGVTSLFSLGLWSRSNQHCDLCGNSPLTSLVSYTVLLEQNTFELCA